MAVAKESSQTQQKNQKPPAKPQPAAPELQLQPTAQPLQRARETPGLASPGDILAMQQRFGNRAVQRMLTESGKPTSPQVAQQTGGAVVQRLISREALEAQAGGLSKKAKFFNSTYKQILSDLESYSDLLQKEAKEQGEGKNPNYYSQKIKLLQNLSKNASNWLSKHNKAVGEMPVMIVPKLGSKRPKENKKQKKAWTREQRRRKRQRALRQLHRSVQNEIVTVTATTDPGKIKKTKPDFNKVLGVKLPIDLPIDPRHAKITYNRYKAVFNLLKAESTRVNMRSKKSKSAMSDKIGQFVSRITALISMLHNPQSEQSFYLQKKQQLTKGLGFAPELAYEKLGLDISYKDKSFNEVIKAKDEFLDGKFGKKRTEEDVTKWVNNSPEGWDFRQAENVFNAPESKFFYDVFLKGPTEFQKYAALSTPVEGFDFPIQLMGLLNEAKALRLDFIVESGPRIKV